MRPGRYMRSLQQLYALSVYGKLLIPGLGTYLSRLQRRPVAAGAAGASPVVPAISFQSLSERFCFSRLLASPISNLSRLISVSCTDFDCFQELSLTCPL